MNYLPRYFGLALVLVGLGVTASAASKSTLVSLGDETYSIVRQANNGLIRDTAALKAEALQDAASYCVAHGKQQKVISATELKPLFVTADYAKAKVIFKALNADDPALRNENPPQRVDDSVTSTPAKVSSPAGTQGDLYTELIKLDELRKKGILTEEEFQVEKKKVLSRSK